MNSFLKELESKLNILSKEEREDIISEYKSNIEEKIKSGKTEKEAVEDFGDIDLLAKDILSAYKINPEYGDKKTDGVENFEDAIKKVSSKLADFTDKVVDKVKVNNENITLEKVFEIILKVIVLLIGLLLLKIPFSIIGSIVANIISFGIFDGFTYHFVKLLFNILYLVVCIVIIIIAAKRYTNKVTYDGENIEDKIERDTTKLDKDTCKQEKKNTKKKEVRETKKEDSIFIKIVKIFVIVVFMIPLLFSIIGLVISVVVLIYLTIKTALFLGPLLIVLGVLFMFCFFYDIIYSLTIRRKPFCIFNLISSVVIMSVGVIITFNSYLGITYVNEAPTNIETNLRTYNKDINGTLYFNDDFDSTTIKIDDTLEDDKAVIEVTYYNGFSKYDLEYNNSEYYAIDLFVNRGVNELVNVVIDNMKDNKIYNYKKLFESSVTIRVNSNTANKIVIN